MKNIKVKKKSITKIIIVFFLFYNSFKSDEKMEIKKYLNICNKKEISNIYHYQNNKTPKVSIISPVYNREKYLIRFINSIQNQLLNDFEILFVDDSSKDNSCKIIEDCQKIDERILLIKNRKNRGTFISRNIGVLKSKGKYIMLPDPDDILFKNIIQDCYDIAENNNYEMIRFNIYLGNGKIFFSEIVNNLKSIPIYQPDLSRYLFYGLGKLREIDFNISNKFIKRSSFIIALNYLEKYYLNLYSLIYEDGLMNFILYRTVKSLYFLKKIGYYYILDDGSLTKRGNIDLDKFLKFLYIYSKIVFDYTKNTFYEKSMVTSLLDEYLKLNNRNIY